MRISKQFTEEEVTEIVRKEIVAANRELTGGEVVSISSRTGFPVLQVLQIAKREKVIVA